MESDQQGRRRRATSRWWLLAVTLLSYGLSVNAVTGANLTDSSAALSGAELHKGALAHTVRNGTGTFRVNEGHIIGPNGQPFIATGLSTYCEPPGEDIFDVRGCKTAITNFSTGAPLTSVFPNINYVRWCTSSVKAPLPPAAWFGRFVDTLTALQIVTVIQDCDYPTTLKDGALTDAEKAYAGWASAFNGNPYVWFATQNEPNNTNQQNAMISGIYKAIRGTGNNTIVLIDPATYSTSGMDASMFREFNNVVWDVHFYGWIPAACIYSCEPAASLAGNINAMGAITSANGVVPTIVGEFGGATDGCAEDPNAEAVIHAVLGSGHGFAAWYWNGGDCKKPGRLGSDNLLAAPNFDRAPMSLTPFGQMVATAIQNGPGPNSGDSTSGGNGPERRLGR